MQDGGEFDDDSGSITISKSTWILKHCFSLDL